MSTKEAAIEVIRQLPDDVSWDDIAYEMHVRQKIEEGLRQIDAGEVVEHEEVMKRLSRWLD